jgi:hypothetical protein
MLRFEQSNESIIVAMQGCTNIIVFAGHPCCNKQVTKVKGESDKKQQKVRRNLYKSLIGWMNKS